MSVTFRDLDVVSEYSKHIATNWEKESASFARLPFDACSLTIQPGTRVTASALLHLTMVFLSSLCSSIPLARTSSDTTENIGAAFPANPGICKRTYGGRKGIVRLYATNR